MLQHDSSAALYYDTALARVYSVNKNASRMTNMLCDKDELFVERWSVLANDPAARVADSSVDLLEVQAGTGEHPSSGEGVELHRTCIVLDL